MAARFETWSRSHAGQPAERVAPTSERDVVAIVRRAAGRGQRVKVVGAGHSFSPIALTDGVLVQLDGMDRRVHVDKQRGHVTWEAGVRLRAFNDALAAEGLALPIVGSIDQQSLGGLLATGTHGSSLRHGNLSTQIVALRMVTGRGDVLVLDEGDPRLPAARVALGALGIVTEVTLRVVPAFQVAEQTVPLPFDEAVAAFADYGRAHEYAKWWWLPHTDRAQIFHGTRVTEPSTFSPRLRAIDEKVVNAAVFRGLLALGNAVPALIPALNRLIGAVYFRPTRVVGRSDHVLTLAMPPVHRESEWSIPVAHAADALRHARALIEDRGLRVNFILEARFVRADDTWMSPAYGRDSVQIGAYTTARQDREAWFDGFAAIARAYGGRPHWGKEAAYDAAYLRAVYPMLGAFAALARELDPAGVFRNHMLDRVLAPVDTQA